MKTVHAIYKDGVFQPLQAVDLPDHCEVEFEPRAVRKTGGSGMEPVYAVLSERYESGHTDTAARHDEHQR